MTTGGSTKNMRRALDHSIKRLWKAFHDDQRLSWIGHGLICLAGGGAIGLATAALAAALEMTFVPAAPLLANAIADTVGLGFFMFREAADEDYHRNVLKDWDKLDKDRNIRGTVRMLVTPRGDKIGDLMGPIFVCASGWTTYALAHLGG